MFSSVFQTQVIMIETLDIINIKEKGKKIMFIFPLKHKFSVTGYYGQQTTPVFTLGNNNLLQQVMQLHLIVSLR